MTPEKIGKYTVIELLGRGGMGEVYLGEDPYIGRRVAIKIIKGADPDARDRFLHEARVIGGLAHPAIVSLLDFDFSGNEPFLVMELLKGQGLDVWLRNPHSLPEQLVVLEDLCDALSYAHENGVLHRDVKPSNVQILPNGHAKLMDFGIARAAAGKLTATGAIMGTPEYMAPEILNDVAYSSRSDLYACAVLLYEMFTGKNPFAAGTVAATLTNVLTLNPPDLRSVRPDLPEPLAAALMDCLRKQPELRPPDFGSLTAAARSTKGSAVMQPPAETRALPRPAEKASPPVPKETEAPRKTPWAPVGGAVLLVGLGAAWLLNRGPARTEPEPSTPSPQPTIVAALPSPPPPATFSPSPAPSALPAAVTPAPTPRKETARPLEPKTRVEPTPPSTPTQTPVASPLPSVAVPTPTPAPIPSSTVAPAPTSSPVVVEPSQPPISVSGVTPRTLRRGSSVDLEVQGEGLRRDLKAIVMQGRRQASGIRVVRTEFVSARLIRVRVLIEAETPLLTYSLMFQDSSGASTQGVQIEVVL